MSIQNLQSLEIFWRGFFCFSLQILLTYVYTGSSTTLYRSKVLNRRVPLAILKLLSWLSTWKKQQLYLIKLVGVPPGMCAVALCVWMWLSFGHGKEGLCFNYRTRGCGRSDVGVSTVTCDLWILSSAYVGVAWYCVEERREERLWKATKVWDECDCG